MNVEKPLVSIICLTFNHEAFIRDALDSFLIQKTSFFFEILVHDDASTDSTPEIVKEYQTKYPKIVKPTFQETNQFSKGYGYVGINICLRKSKGKYVAYCEGDDYWIDPLKLQKQVDFLNVNEEFSLCTHDTLFRNDYDSKRDGVLYSKLLSNIFINSPKNIYTLEDTFTGNIFHISSIMFRNTNIEFPRWVNRFSACDMVLFMLLAEKGSVYYMDDIMSVYRNNVYSMTSKLKEYSSSILFLNMSLHILRLMNRHFKREYQNKIYPLLARYYMRLAFVYLSKSNRSYKKARKMIKMAFLYDPKNCIIYLFNESYFKLKQNMTKFASKV